MTVHGGGKRRLVIAYKEADAFHTSSASKLGSLAESVSREPKLVNSKLTNRPDHTEKKRRDWNVMGDSILFWTLLAVIAANSLLVAVAVLNVRRASKY